ncbi:radical SAM protein [Salmonella enterica]|nr:radical SAM protein [Salmonella enterica]EAX3608924.1 radical SAM protein [Salmonella enterica]EGW6282462.1 radical SAM protein [Salmonella enterica]EGX3934945.1 radical SAM protein [Salmonella enterica]
MKINKLTKKTLPLALNTIFSHVNELNMEKLFRLGAKISTDSKAELLQLANMCRDKDPMVSGWLKTMRTLGPFTRNKLISNLIFNHVVTGAGLRDKAGEKYGTHIPFLVLISPTYECNLECKGCYSALYGNRYHYTEEEIFDLIQQFYDLGIRFFTFTGGEPFVYKPLMKLFEHFDDYYFMVFTNGTMLTESRVEKLARLGNIAITISVEGFEDMTDWRRGNGTWQKILQAYERLNRHGVMRGVSVMATSKNNEQICSTEFWDFMLENLGISYAWIFQYMPIGRDATMDLVPSAEQRYHRFHFLETLRKSGRLGFLADFWNHGFLVNGCMSGGANYLHVNAKGGAEPCVFQPYATDNVREKRIIDILKSPFFEGYKQQIPFNDNLMQPCPIIDNPSKFREHIQMCHAIPQHDGSDSYFRFAKELDTLAEEWKKYAIKIWTEEGYGDEYHAEHNLYVSRSNGQDKCSSV